MNDSHKFVIKISLITTTWLGGTACLALVFRFSALGLSSPQAWIVSILASGVAVCLAFIIDLLRPSQSPQKAPEAVSTALAKPISLETFFGLLAPLPRRPVPKPVTQLAAPARPLVIEPPSVSATPNPVRSPEPTLMKHSEKDFITRTLVHKYKLAIAISRVVNTPDFYCYLLAVHQRETLDRLEAILKNLGNDIYQYRRLSEPVNVKLVHQFPHLQVSKPEHLRRPLQWRQRPRVLASHVTLLGAAWNGPQPQPVVINLADPKQAHVALFSSTGGGKSVLLNAMTLGLMESSSPADTEIYFVDLESHQFDVYEILPHVRFVARTEEDALDVITYLAELVEADRDLSNTMRRVLVIDEAQLLTEAADNADDFQRLLIYLAKVGRKHRFNLWLATQDPTGDNVPTGIQRNIKVVVAGQTTDDSYLKRYFKVQGASQLTGDGDFLIMSGANQRRFKSFWLDFEARELAMKTIIQRWGTDEEVLLFVPAEGAPEEAAADESVKSGANLEPVSNLSPQEQRVQVDAARIRDLLLEAYDFEQGRIKAGWGVKLIAAIYGESKPSEGLYRQRMMEAVDYLLDHQKGAEDVETVITQASRKLALGWKYGADDLPAES